MVNILAKMNKCMQFVHMYVVQLYVAYELTWWNYFLSALKFTAWQLMWQSPASAEGS